MFLIILFSFSLNLYASDEYLYYSGESSGDSPEKVLKEEAYQNALRNLILENFGANINVEDGTTDKINFGRVFVDSPMVSLKGLTIHKSEVDSDRALVILKISKSDLKQAKLSSSNLTDPLIRENNEVGNLSLMISPPDSAVTINGLPVVDMNNISLQIGIKHKISVRHQDYLAQELEIVLSDKDPIGRVINLKSIPSKIKITLIPASADLYIDGKRQTNYKNEFYLEHGEHLITAKKNGYFDKEYKVNIAPNSKSTNNVQMKLKLRTLKERELSLEYHPLWAGVGYQLLNPLNVGASFRIEDIEYAIHGSLVSSDWGVHNNTHKLHNSMNTIQDYSFTLRKYLSQTNKYQFGFGVVGGILMIEKNNDPERKESIATW